MIEFKDYDLVYCTRFRVFSFLRISDNVNYPLVTKKSAYTKEGKYYYEDEEPCLVKISLTYLIKKVLK